MLTKITRFVTLACLLIGLTVAITTKGIADKITVSSTVPPGHIVTRVAIQANEYIKQAGNGNITLNIQAYGKLGSVPTIISLLQSGAIEIGLIPLGDIALRDSAFYGWFVPLTFNNFREAAKAIDTPANQKLMSRLNEQGLVPLAFVFPGQRHVISTFPIKTMEDFKGKKVRAFPNEGFKEWWRAIGASPTPVRLPELPQALQMGVLDAVDTDLDLVLGLKLHKMAKYLVLTNHMAFPCVYMASKVWWDKLPEKELNLIKTGFKDAEKWGIETQTIMDIKNLEQLKEDGAVVTAIEWDSLKVPAEKAKTELLKLNPLVKEFLDEVKK